MVVFLDRHPSQGFIVSTCTAIRGSRSKAFPEHSAALSYAEQRKGKQGRLVDSTRIKVS